MSNVLIKAEQLSKTYRLYDKPFYRFLDAFGILPGWIRGYREHHAVESLEIEIEAGEKLAVIGRNGAGKSTLLKMLGGVTHPTSGRLDVNGEISALLTLGTGFHQDFTGRENVDAYLAQMGMSERDIRRIFDSIVDFAELQDFIDQPLKTYSTGMQMRLGFAVSTVLRPEILIIDEVLSVGDAYFFKKSYERIHEMCTANGTTLIMVTHDLYSALSMCDRAIWLDEGRIRADGPVKEVVNAYEASIKEQEEKRLRHKWRDAVLNNAQSATRVLLGEIKTADGETVQDGFHISGMRIADEQGDVLALSMDDTSFDSAKGGLILDGEEVSWGECESLHGRTARMFTPFGSIYQKLQFFLSDARAVEAYDKGQLDVKIDYLAHAGQHFSVTLREADDRAKILEQEFLAEPGNWRTADVPLASRDDSESSSGVAFARYGQRTVEIKQVRFSDESGQDSFQFQTGGAFHAEIDYRINDPDFDEKPTILIAFQKDGKTRTHRLVTQDTRLCAKDGVVGTLHVDVDPIQFTAGTYLLNVAIFAEGFFESGDTNKFFTVNERLYDMHSRAYEIVVSPVPEKPLWNDVLFLQEGRWRNEVLDEAEMLKRSLPQKLSPCGEEVPAGTWPFPFDRLQPSEAVAVLDDDGDLRCRTHVNTASYALLSADLEGPNPEVVANGASVSIGVEKGGVALNLYDPDNDVMLAGATCAEGECTLVELALPEDCTARRVQLIVSNNLAGRPGQSDFTMHYIRVH